MLTPLCLCLCFPQFPLPEEDGSAEGVEDLAAAAGTVPRQWASGADAGLHGEFEDELEALLYRRPFNTRLLTIHSNACLGSSAGPNSGLTSGPTEKLELPSGFNTASRDGVDKALTSNRFIFTGSSSGGMLTLGSRPPSVPIMDRIPASHPSSLGVSFAGPLRLHCEAGDIASTTGPPAVSMAGKHAAGSSRAQAGSRSVVVSRTAGLEASD